MSIFGDISVRIFPALSRIRTEYGALRIQSECGENAGKMRTRIIPNTDTFYAVMLFRDLLYLLLFLRNCCIFWNVSLD